MVITSMTKLIGVSSSRPGTLPRLLRRQVMPPMPASRVRSPATRHQPLAVRSLSALLCCLCSPLLALLYSARLLCSALRCAALRYCAALLFLRCAALFCSARALCLWISLCSALLCAELRYAALLMCQLLCLRSALCALCFSALSLCALSLCSLSLSLYSLSPPPVFLSLSLPLGQESVWALPLQQAGQSSGRLQRCSRDQAACAPAAEAQPACVPTYV